MAVYIQTENIVTMAPAPVFSWNGKVSLATIYFSHYTRLEAVVAAARTGNETLIRLALHELDRYGSRDGIESDSHASKEL